jgi:hypothetical protein
MVPILAARSMQRDPRPIEALAHQALHRPGQGIEGVRIDAAPKQRRQHGIAAQQ